MNAVERFIDCQNEEQTQFVGGTGRTGIQRVG